MAEKRGGEFLRNPIVDYFWPQPPMWMRHHAHDDEDWETTVKFEGETFPPEELGSENIGLETFRVPENWKCKKHRKRARGERRRRRPRSRRRRRRPQIQRRQKLNALELFVLIVCMYILFIKNRNTLVLCFIRCCIYVLYVFSLSLSLHLSRLLLHQPSASIS